MKRDDGAWDVLERHVAVELAETALEAIDRFPDLRSHRHNCLRLQIWLKGGAKKFLDEDFSSLVVVMAKVRAERSKPEPEHAVEAAA